MKITPHDDQTIMSQRNFGLYTRNARVVEYENYWQVTNDNDPELKEKRNGRYKT